MKKIFQFLIVFFGLFLIGCEPESNETEQVATPSASIAAGIVDIGTEITLSCATEGTTIHYTLDGSTPTPSSEKYTTPIVIDSAVTIKAIAVKVGMDNSEVLTVKYSVDINSLFTMKVVAGGTFTMGCTGEQGSDCEDHENPAHQVTLSDFSVSETEVTQALWLAVMGSWPGTTMFPSNRLGLGSNYPAYYVSWEDIVGTSSSAEGYTVNGVTYYQNGFCYKLSQLVGGGKKFRLPTEAEWEYAARGGNMAESQTKYSGSDNIDEVAWYFENSNGDNGNSFGSHEVGKKRANALGLYDMSGNIWELCSDWYGAYSSESQTNPTGGSAVDEFSRRVLRGGFWLYSAKDCRISHRSGELSGQRGETTGFRLAL